MTPRLRKLALTAHVTVSVGWAGAVAVFLALAITGLASHDALLVRSVYAAMGPTGWFVIVPLCFASLATGVVSSLGTAWGLFRYYWVVVKLVITVLSTLVLLIHMGPIARISRMAAATTWSGGELEGLRVQLVVQSSAALAALVVATALSVYKPPGRTRYGLHKQRATAEAIDAAASSEPLGSDSQRLRTSTTAIH
ncbi:hypothetical protein [Streptomyces sp. NPDC004533]|uniref:hypothetical protein n=1 Tax=Streptomyces sp. NPDC004533 TaxID=3154278 RepID=UPI0033AC2580